MNVNDGNLSGLLEAQEEANGLGQNFADMFCAVEEKDMTKKQKKEKKVSLKDHRSKLGVKLTYERKERKIGRNEPCACGSGLKHKKCCLNGALGK